MMKLWLACFNSVEEVRALGTRVRKVGDSPASRAGSGPTNTRTPQGVGEGAGEDWWDDVSHQAQRVAHVAAASAFASGGREVRLDKCITCRSAAARQHGYEVLVSICCYELLSENLQILDWCSLQLISCNWRERTTLCLT